MHRRLVNILLVLAVVAVVTLAAHPWECYTDNYCKYCYAQVRRYTFFDIPLPGVVREGELARYYRHEVDTRHRHDWAETYTISYGEIVAEPCTWSPITPAQERRAVSLLRRLPDPASRKALVEQCLTNDDWYWDGIAEMRLHLRMHENMPTPNTSPPPHQTSRPTAGSPPAPSYPAAPSQNALRPRE
jgi:hypothetical protein